MRITRLLFAAVLAVGLAAAVPSTAQAAGPQYYLALGDSLAAGFQPGGDTTAGYAYDVYNHLKASHPTLQLINLGCDGETTTTMIVGPCPHTPVTPYVHTGTQLGDAVYYLHTLGSAVKYMTIDIGANDVDGCLPGGVPNPQCILQGTESIATNLHTILAALSAAAGSSLPKSAGMAYYDPFLAAWLTGAQGQAVATATVPLAAGVNSLEGTEYTAYHFKVADVFNVFKTADFVPVKNTPPYGKLPLNVSKICTWTYMCSQANIHPNDTGYTEIAKAFDARL